jgi:hypothetical protein
MIASATICCRAVNSSMSAINWSVAIVCLWIRNRLRVKVRIAIVWGGRSDHNSRPYTYKLCTPSKKRCVAFSARSGDKAYEKRTQLAPAGEKYTPGTTTTP